MTSAEVAVRARRAQSGRLTAIQSQGGWRGEQTRSQKVTNQHSPCLKAKVVHSAHMGGREGYWQREQQKEG